MKRSVLCVSAAVLLCLAFFPRPAGAQTGLKIEDARMERTNYPPVLASEGPVKIYAGDWSLTAFIHNYNIDDGYGAASSLTTRIFLDNVLIEEPGFYGVYVGGVYQGYGNWNGISTGFTGGTGTTLTLSGKGYHQILIQVWHGTETQPQDTYSFNVLVMKPEVSGLQASSKVVRALGDNSFVVSFTNGGNENMRQAVLSMANSGGLTITPNSVELGDVTPSEQVSASFEVSSSASVTLGTALVRFSLSFIDYAGVSHTEDVSGTVEVYRLSPTLTVSAPNSVENGDMVEIAATLKDPGGNPIANENITLTAGGVTLGTFKTDSSGVARASYKATETGTVNVGASFSGSASYDASSTSGEFTVTPAAAFPYWVVLLIALPIALAAVLMIWRRKRGEVRPPRKVRRSKATS